MNRLIFGFVIWSLCLFTFTCKAFADTTDTEVPFSVEKGQVIVAPKIHGNVPVEVALATGIEHSLVNAALLSKYKLQAAYTGEGIITGGNLDRVVYFVPVSDVRVGDSPARSLNMRLGAQTTGDISQKVGREIFAVLGADFFKGHIVQFDFEKKLLRFISHRPANATLNRGVDEFATLPMRPSDKAVRLPITEGITFNGKKIRTLLDVGALTVASLTHLQQKR